ncbi:hypothetical protein QJS66_01945 [Kocuria rhizophila]|nr:hypothetical protein QJS66_01945 [Kocuria rhizophila]
MARLAHEITSAADQGATGPRDCSRTPTTWRSAAPWTSRRTWGWAGP